MLYCAALSETTWHSKKSLVMQRQAGLPKWLYKELQQQYPEQLDDIPLAMQHTAPMWLRINPHYVSVSQYQQMLNDRNIASTTIDALPHGLCLATPAVVTELPDIMLAGLQYKTAPHN